MKLLRPERFNQVPDALLLDLDNTLYPYAPAHDAALSAVGTKVVQTLAISPEEFRRAFEEARRQVKHRLGRTASAHSRLLYMQRLLETLGLGSQVLLALDLEQTYWRTFLSRATLFEGVVGFLDELRVLGIPTAIVTDLTVQIQFRKVVHLGLDHHVDCIVTSEEAGHDKPHAAPFQLALDKLRPRGARIWMVGDDAEADIRGAREALGAITLQKLHAGVPQGTGDSSPDGLFGDYMAMRKLLGRLGGTA
jgi:putative hydrolase of the HAD superfamily